MRRPMENSFLLRAWRRNGWCHMRTTRWSLSMDTKKVWNTIATVYRIWNVILRCLCVEVTVDQTTTRDYETTFQPDEGMRGTYLLQPMSTTRDRGKRKRKLVIDSCKVLTNKMIRTQLSDCGDTTYQTRTFPPISRRAIQCKAKCADETLLTMPSIVSVTRITDTLRYTFCLLWRVSFLVSILLWLTVIATNVT